MVRRALLIVALLTGLVSSSGCATADGMQEKFYDASRGYNRALRWGDFDRAAEHLPDASVDAFLEQHEEVADKLIILEYQLTRLKLDKQSGKASSRVEISWHTDDRLIVESTVVDQNWQFWEGKWYLVDERRARGKPLAIFAESPPREEEEPASELEAEGELEVASDEPHPASSHPYLPGLDEFRNAHDIGLSPQQKRVRDRDRRRAKRRSDAPQDDPFAANSRFDERPGM